MLASIATWLPTASQKMLYEGSHVILILFIFAFLNYCGHPVDNSTHFVVCQSITINFGMSAG